jgi:hypothetical protein
MVISSKGSRSVAAGHYRHELHNGERYPYWVQAGSEEVPCVVREDAYQDGTLKANARAATDKKKEKNIVQNTIE